MRTNRKILSAIYFCIAICACMLDVQAQSGRRKPNAAPAAPIPTPTPEPTPNPKVAQKEPDLIIVVGADRNESFSFYPYTYFDAVVSGCSAALRKNSSAKVDPSSGSLNRGEAIKKAKADAKTFVVLLQLKGQTMSGGSNNTSGDQIELEYTVFAPGTAKTVTSGRTYQNANRAGPVVVGPTGGSSSVLYREQLLKRAGEQAGERILRALHLDTPRTN